MNGKKDYYTNYVDYKIRIRKLVYFVIFLITFCLVLYDSFMNGLPFHYILFFVIGRIMSLILRKTQKVKWRETDTKFTFERNFSGILIIVTVLILRIFLFPRILTELSIVFISDALLLFVMGWFQGRIKLLSDKIEEKAFSRFEETKRPRGDKI